MGLDNPLHIAVLVVILLLVFGARRLPMLGRSLGTGMREFKEGITGEGLPPAADTPPTPAMQVPVTVTDASASSSPAAEDSGTRAA